MTNYHCRLCGASWSAPVTTCPAGCDDPRVNTVHVRPVADAIEHATNGDDCPCGPHVEAVFRADGADPDSKQDRLAEGFCPACSVPLVPHARIRPHGHCPCCKECWAMVDGEVKSVIHH